MQARRYWIEHAFGEAKSNLGMAEYELRGWLGWHHHMALVYLAQLFTLKERIALQEEMPLLNLRDIVKVLDYYLPRRNRSEQDILAISQKRHRERQKSINTCKTSQVGNRWTKNYFFSREVRE